MELKPGYKQTEVGVIPEEWRVEALGHHVEIKSGESPSLFRFENDGVPYFKVEQLNRNSKYLRDTPYFFRGDKKVPRNSLIFPKRGASILLNKVRILEQDAFMDTNLMTLTPKGSMDHEYLYYALTYIELWRIADTTSIPQINNKHIIPLVLPLPTPLEQRAIAGALGDVDALLGALEKLIAKKRDLKQAAMQQLLTGQTRLPGFADEWGTKQLGDVIAIKKGQLITEKDAMHGNIPVIAGGKKPSYFHNRANRTGKTITISGSGANAGYVAFFETPIFASDCSTISEGAGYAIKFIYYFLQLRQEEIYKAQTGGAQPHIHPSDLRPLTLGVPGLDEQTAIAGVLSDMDAEIEALEQRLAKTRALKQGMMQELLTGRVRLI